MSDFDIYLKYRSKLVDFYGHSPRFNLNPIQFDGGGVLDFERWLLMECLLDRIPLDNSFFLSYNREKSS